MEIWDNFSAPLDLLPLLFLPPPATSTTAKIIAFSLWSIPPECYDNDPLLGPLQASASTSTFITAGLPLTLQFLHPLLAPRAWLLSWIPAHCFILMLFRVVENNFSVHCFVLFSFLLTALGKALGSRFSNWPRVQPLAPGAAVGLEFQTQPFA